jgi:hypothetical protein
MLNARLKRGNLTQGCTELALEFNTLLGDLLLERQMLLCVSYD